MRVIEELYDYTSEKHTAISIGKFDGLHKGHQLLINKINEYSSPETDRVILAFDIGDKVLLTTEEQREFLKDKIDVLITCPLTDRIKEMSPEKFVEEILVNRLKVKCLVIGMDFRFGHERKGDLDLLKELSKVHGFQICIVNQVRYDGEVISSTTIKGEIEKGNVNRANNLLGYEYVISGIVIHGKRLARTLGFPTLNIYPNVRKVIPKFGVYRCKLEIGPSVESACSSIPKQTNGKRRVNQLMDEKEKSGYCGCQEEKSGNSGDWKEYNGLCNIGLKPTVTDEAKITVEVHLFDFEEEAYEKMVRIKLLDFIREEQKFNSTKELKEQIKKDVEGAMKWIKN